MQQVRDLRTSSSSLDAASLSASDKARQRAISSKDDGGSLATGESCWGGRVRVGTCWRQIEHGAFGLDTAAHLGGLAARSKSRFVQLPELFLEPCEFFT